MSDQIAQAHGERNIIVQASGSGHTINIHGFAHLTLIAPSRHQARKAVRDLDLLDPGTRAVPLTGRDQDQADLNAWLAGEHTISVRTVTGPGGSGKTRLALETMLTLPDDAATGWNAGFLAHAEARRFVAAQNLSSWGWQRDTLIVIDYAASLAPELGIMLSELVHSERAAVGPRLRLLLLERHASAETAWYNSLVPGDWQREAVRDLFDPWEPIEIRPVQELADRFAILRTTLERAAALGGATAPGLPELGTDPAFEQRLMDPQWTDPLMLMMAALTALHTGVATALSLSRPEMAGRLAEREIARIHKFAPQSERYAGNLLVQVAAFATLCGGLSEEDARSAAADQSAALGLQYPGGHGATVPDLHNALPGFDGGVAPVRPDLIGEAFLLEVWKPKPAVGSLARALAVAGQKPVAVLVRVAQDFGGDREPRPVQWLESLLSRATDGTLLRAIHNALPQETVCLREFALQVVTALLPLAGGEERGPLLIDLSNRQSALGLREQALASIEEAVGIYRDLAAAYPDVFRSDLAASLSNRSNHQSALGQREQALASIEEAVRFFRDLAVTVPEVFRRDLALSLNNLSSCQMALGQREQALASMEEAVRFYRGFAITLPDVFRPELAGSLNNLSNRQNALGLHDLGLASSEEAVGLYRDLAATRPDAFRPYLAMSLNNLSIRQSALKLRRQALASSEEAVRVYRDLAATRPDAFRPDLADSLNSLSICQSYQGQLEQALASSEEAVRLYRGLDATRRDTFRPALAMSLNNLSNRQSALGQRDEALASSAEAVRHYRDLAREFSALEPDFARSLGVLADCYSASGDPANAFLTVTEALTRLRPSFIAFPSVFSNLARGLGTAYRNLVESLDCTPDMDILKPYLQYFNQPKSPEDRP